jgi:nucleoside 2-deoxyribosyltransferase
MTGLPDYNFSAFNEAALKLREEGFKVISPAELDEDSGPEPPAEGEKYGPEYVAYLKRDVQHVIEVDAVVVLPGWDKSRGAKFETYLAAGLDKPVFRYATGSRVSIEEVHAPITEETILEEAQRLVDGPRGQAYGHPAEDFGRTAKIVGAILGIEVTAHQIPLIMMAVKLSRHTNRPRRDNMTDIAGYARTAEMVAERVGGWEK